MIRYLIRRLLYIPLTLLAITAVLYGMIMLSPPIVRAQLYLPPRQNLSPGATSEAAFVERIVEEYGLDDPYPVQYGRWLANLVQGNWGWSPALNDPVLETLLERTPATVELTLYSVLLLIPLGLASGVVAGWRQGRLQDHGFRATAFVATSIPPFVLAFVLLAIFYVAVNWFPPGRISTLYRFDVVDESFRTFTGLLTVDGLLNGRPEIALDALRHLVLPVFTLSLTHWATVGRVTRAAMIEELNKEYVMAARGRGLSMRRTVWRHALRNAALPGLNSIALSAAALIGGVFVVEVVYNYPGVSEVLVQAISWIPDPAAAVGFAVYSVLMVLPLMLVLDVVQALVDPRLREGVA